MLRKDAKIDLPRRVPLFAERSKRELTQIAGIADELPFPADKVLLQSTPPVAIKLLGSVAERLRPEI